MPTRCDDAPARPRHGGTRRRGRRKRVPGSGLPTPRYSPGQRFQPSLPLRLSLPPPPPPRPPRRPRRRVPATAAPAVVSLVEEVMGQVQPLEAVLHLEGAPRVLHLVDGEAQRVLLRQHRSKGPGAEPRKQGTCGGDRPWHGGDTGGWPAWGYLAAASTRGASHMRDNLRCGGPPTRHWAGLRWRGPGPGAQNLNRRFEQAEHVQRAAPSAPGTLPRGPSGRRKAETRRREPRRMPAHRAPNHRSGHAAAAVLVVVAPSSNAQGRSRRLRRGQQHHMAPRHLGRPPAIAASEGGKAGNWQH